MMKRVRVIMVWGFALFMLGAVAVQGADAKQEKPVQYRTIDSDNFQSFVKNWDDKVSPVLYAVIRAPGDWDTVFHPAPVMGKELPFGPDKELFEKEQMLIVSRMVKPSAAFEVDAVSDTGNALVLRYTLVDPKSEAGCTIKAYMAVVIPKHEYKTISFIENGKGIGMLNLEEGQWSVPPLESKIEYRSSELGFRFLLPAGWKGFSVQKRTWEGWEPRDQGNVVVEKGPLISIAHPESTEKQPRQDIPIMVFTTQQWDRVEKEEIRISAAPVGPRELGRNSLYVFALPPRYNFDYKKGWEEVEHIIGTRPLGTFEPSP